MPPLMRRGTLAAVLLALAACGGTMGARDVAGLDGVWEGDINRARSEQTFCRRWGLRLTIRNGAVAGEAFDLNARTTPATFQSYVETDGRLFADARVGGDVLRISGAFSGNSFSGESQSVLGCRGFISLSRARPAR